MTAGTLTLYRRNCRQRTYTAGQTFVERGRHDVVLARNEGQVQAETITTLIVPHGVPARIDQPAHCGLL